MKIGIYGGSFDPIHLAHLQVAEAVYTQLELDELFFIPAARSPFKGSQRMAPDRLRLRWIQIALEDYPQFSTDDREIIRGGISYTIETVREYALRFPHAELFYIIGMDNLSQLPCWFRAQELARLVQFAVVTRPEAECILPPAPFRCRIIKGVHSRISSHEIRERIAGGKPVTGMLPEKIIADILESNSYKEK